MGRVSSWLLAVRKMASTSHSCLYLSASSRADRSVLVVNTHLPSNRASALILSSSDGESAAAGLHVLAVADQLLVTGLERRLERCDDRFAVMSILGGLVLVETDDVAAILDPDLLDLEWGRCLRIVALRIDLLIVPNTRTASSWLSRP